MELQGRMIDTTAKLKQVQPLPSQSYQCYHNNQLVLVIFHGSSVLVKNDSDKQFTSIFRMQPPPVKNPSLLCYEVVNF